MQGVIELALKRLKPANEIDTLISSRTDAGVHALNTTLHVDLVRQDGKAYNPNYITHYLNNSFYKYDIPICISSTYVIPPDLTNFHARYSAKGRTYLYRLAILKPEKVPSDAKDYVPQFIPIEEADRCHFIVTPEFDTDAVQAVLPLIKGRHDFRTFMGMNDNTRLKSCTYSLRTITDISFTPSQSSSCIFNRKKAQEYYNYYDLVITGRSFLYRQVRRIVGTLVRVAQGHLSHKDVYEMITIPSQNTWSSTIHVMPARGLYLCEVHYDPDVLNTIRRYNESLSETTGRKKSIETN